MPFPKIMPVTLRDIEEARTRLGNAVALTPCPESIPLSEITGAHIYCKMDCFQRTGSFKERGARNALLLLDEEKRKKGVIAASAGNHALGLAYHGSLLDIPVAVVMPVAAPLIKITTCQKMGADVILHGDSFQEARALADKLAAEKGFTYIHGYDDPAIIAGQGTMALEILEQVPDVEAIVCPIGGGGLIAGVSIAVKALNPEVKIIGVEAEATGSFQAALQAKKPVFLAAKPTLADGLAVCQVGENAFTLAKDLIDQIVTVGEDDLALAILRNVELEKEVVEGAAASTLAAFLAGALPHLAGRKVVLLYCGGNIDPTILSRVIEKGLVADGRLCRFTAVISDRPGGLAGLAKAIASSGASVKDISHDRAFAGSDVAAVNCLCTVETRDRAHLEELLDTLRKDGISILEK
jgi:threonine dehydratase